MYRSCKISIQGKWGDPILLNRGCSTDLSKHCSTAEVEGAVPACQEADFLHYYQYVVTVERLLPVFPEGHQ